MSAAVDVECNTIIRNNHIFATKKEINLEYCASSARNLLTNQTNINSSEHKEDNDPNKSMLEMQNESVRPGTGGNTRKAKHRLLFRDMSIRDVVVVRSFNNDLNTSTHSNKSDFSSSRGSKLDVCHENHQIQEEDNQLREVIEAGNNNNQEEEKVEEQQQQQQPKKEEKKTKRQVSSGSRKKLVKQRTKKKLTDGVDTGTTGTDPTRSNSTKILKKKKKKIKLLQPDEEGYLEQQHRRLTKKIAANNRKSKHDILDAKSRFEFAKIQQKEYKEKIKRLEITNHVVRNQRQISIGSVERKALQNKLRNRKELVKEVEKNNTDLMNDSFVVRGGSFCRGESLTALLEESGVVNKKNKQRRRDDIVIVRVNENEEKTLVIQDEQSSSSDSSTSSDDDDSSSGSNSAGSLDIFDGKASNNVTQLLSIFDVLQEEELLLREHNEELQVQFKIFHTRYCRIAKERKKLKKSMDAIVEYNNKYMTMAGERSLTSENVQSLIKFAEVTRQIKKTIETCYSSTHNEEMKTKLESEFGPPPSTKAL